VRSSVRVRSASVLGRSEQDADQKPPPLFLGEEAGIEGENMSAAAPAPSDPSKLVERLQTLKKRLANMAKTLETNVASASPVRGVQSDDIVYSTPR
jgi:hypothetical protein